MNTIDYFESPIGTLLIEASSQGLSRLIFVEQPRQQASTNQITERCKQQLQDYFAGRRRQFDMPLDLDGLTKKSTDFQKSIWQRLLAIPFGTTRSYAELAKEINKPKAVRAVGAANGRNPISIILPCHRVIGSDGSLTGYAWGMQRKQWLLKHEGVALPA